MVVIHMLPCTDCEEIEGQHTTEPLREGHSDHPLSVETQALELVLLVGKDLQEADWGRQDQALDP